MRKGNYNNEIAEDAEISQMSFKSIGVIEFKRV